MNRGLAALVLLFSPTLFAATWTSHGPEGGSVVSLVAAPSNPRTMYLASAGGVFRSGDGGASWRRLTVPNVAVSRLAVDPHDPSTVLLGSSSLGGSILRSRDGGETWAAAGQGLPPALQLSALLFDPRDSNVVYVGSHCGPIFKGSPSPAWHEGAGVFKSTDGGATFAAASSGMQSFQICVTQLSIDPVDPDTLYATPVYNDSGYARSDDGARTWTKAATIVPGGGVVGDPGDPQRRYGTGSGFFLTSADGGQTWAPVEPRILDSGQLLTFGIWSLAFDPAAPRLFLGGGQGAYRSGAGGEFVLALPGPARESVHAVVFDPTSGVLTIGTVSGVYQSPGYPWTDWRALPTGDRSRGMDRVAASPRNPSVVYATSIGKLFVSRDSGLSWSVFGESIPLLLSQVGNVGGVTVDAAETIYVLSSVSGRSRVYKRPAGAQQWVDVTPPSEPFGQLVADPKTPGVIYVVGFGTFLVTRDGGGTWENLFTPAPAGYANALAIDPDDSNILYAATVDGLYRSSDGGTSWVRSLNEADSLSQVVVSPADSSTVYADGRDAQFRRVFYRSRDRGQSWTPVSHLPGANIAVSMVADVRDAQTVYLSGNGVYRTRDGGATWENLGGGAPLRSVTRLALSSNGAVLHAATQQGMWRLALVSRKRAVR